MVTLLTTDPFIGSVTVTEPTDNASPSVSSSLLSTSISTGTSRKVEALSLFATGASFTAVTVMLIVATLLSANPKGRDLVRRYEAMKAERLAPILERFEPAEIDQLSHLLERFSVLLFDHEKSGEGFCLRCAAYVEEHCPVGHVVGNCPYERIRSRNRPEDEERERQ